MTPRHLGSRPQHTLPSTGSRGPSHAPSLASCAALDGSLPSLGPGLPTWTLGGGLDGCSSPPSGAFLPAAIHVQTQSNQAEESSFQTLPLALPCPCTRFPSAHFLFASVWTQG